MNDYSLYEMLCTLERIAAQYTQGRSYCPSLRVKAQEIALKTYRVAIIGEFKRGKSSLLNALLGIDVLPTDILPMTASVTRIRYGNEKSVTVQFIDGHTEGRTLEELEAYATKALPENAKMAETVREIIVDYPSVLCSNHLEVLDTPGLNDTERMSEKTLSVLDNIDAAVIVLSAVLPLSLTEKNLILDLIREPGIRHLVFAVNFIDELREKDRDRVIGYISEKLGTEVLQMAQDRGETDSEYLDKALAILSKPSVFGVSARQANEAYRDGDPELLLSSRLPKFKEQLIAILTAAQQQDLPAKTLQIAQSIQKILPQWKDEEERFLSARENYREFGNRHINELLLQMDQERMRTETALLDPNSSDLPHQLRKAFISALCGITLQTNDHTHILSALQCAEAQARKLLEFVSGSLSSACDRMMRHIEGEIVMARSSAQLDSEALATRLSSFHKGSSFPFMVWAESPIPDMPDLKGQDIMPVVNRAIEKTLSQYFNQVERYIASWRVILLRQVREDMKLLSTISDGHEETVSQSKLAALPFMFLQHEHTIQEMCNALSEMTISSR